MQKQERRSSLWAPAVDRTKPVLLYSSLFNKYSKQLNREKTEKYSKEEEAHTYQTQTAVIKLTKLSNETFSPSFLISFFFRTAFSTSANR